MIRKIGEAFKLNGKTLKATNGHCEKCVLSRSCDCYDFWKENNRCKDEEDNQLFFVKVAKIEPIPNKVNSTNWISVDILPAENTPILIKTEHGAIFNGCYSGGKFMQMDGFKTDEHNGRDLYSSFCSISDNWKVLSWMEIPQ